MKVNSTRTKADICPHCGKKLDAVTEVHNEEVKPSKGDITICIGCFNPLIFDDDIKLRKMTADDKTNIDIITINKHIADVRAIIKRRKLH